MAKPNYSYEKRQRDIAKRQKKEDKRKAKAEAKQSQLTQDDQPAVPEPESPE